MPFESVEDARRCVNYLKENAGDLGLDREKIVLAGQAASAAYAAHASAAGAVADLFIISLVVPTRHELSGRLSGH